MPESLREFAYRDGPLPIGDGQTISNPCLVAALIHAAEIGAGDRVLEVGAGSGSAGTMLCSGVKHTLRRDLLLLALEPAPPRSEPDCSRQQHFMSHQ